MGEPSTEPDVQNVEPSEAELMKALDRARLPVATLAEAIPHLRRPFTPEAIRFKVQSVFKKQDGTPFACLIVPYIDARLATERLNRVIPAGWSATYKSVDGSKLMWCALTVDGVTRVDVGESPKGMSKDLVSDALKRAAVQFGVGVSCYALPEIKWFADGATGLEQRGKGDKRTLVLTAEGMRGLRQSYSSWLERFGIDRFGPPLDHGDVVGSTIDEGAPEEETGLAVGEGDGSDPGWRDLDAEQVEVIEALLAKAAEVGLTGLAERATAQMRLNHQPPEVVAAWIAGAREQLRSVEQEPAEAGVVEPEGGTT